MAIIGIFKATNVGYESTLETLTLRANLTIEPANKKNGNQPDFQVFQVPNISSPTSVPHGRRARKKELSTSPSASTTSASPPRLTAAW
jgi:hypothetical protein